METAAQLSKQRFSRNQWPITLTTQQLDTIDYDGSPAEFLNKQSLEALRFNGLEFDELLDKMIRNSQLIVSHFKINPDLFADNVREIYS